LAESTKKYKARHGETKILQSRDRNLRESTGYHADNDSVIVGVNAYSSKGYPYPIVHQFGTDKAGRNNDVHIEARSFMPITHDGELYDNVKSEVLDILLEYLGE
jgi:phage gpG-like protein